MSVYDDTAGIQLKKLDIEMPEKVSILAAALKETGDTYVPAMRRIYETTLNQVRQAAHRGEDKVKLTPAQVNIAKEALERHAKNHKTTDYHKDMLDQLTMTRKQYENRWKLNTKKNLTTNAGNKRFEQAIGQLLGGDDGLLDGHDSPNESTVQLD